MSEWTGSYRKDGRKIMDPPCANGHHSQAMECPECAERVTGDPSGDEWREWYAKRYRRAVREDRSGADSPSEPT